MTDDGCAHLIHPGDRFVTPEPPEYCPEPVLPGSEFCRQHDEADGDDLWWEDLTFADVGDDDSFEEFQ